MPKLKVLSSSEVIKALEILGFEVTGQKAVMWNYLDMLFYKNRFSLQFFPFDNLPENIVDYVKVAIENYRNDIHYSEYGW